MYCLGLTSNFHQYIILSTFDACLWLNKLNFTGRLIYFDYQQRECILDYPQLSNINESSSFSTNFTRFPSFYRSTLSFRDSSKPSNSSLLSNKTNILNSCSDIINPHDEYFSYSYFNSHLSQLSSRPLFDSLNLIIRILTSNILNCKTHRLKQIKKKLIHSNYPDVNIFSTRKASSNHFDKQIELIGRYSTVNNTYRSCYENENKDVFLTKQRLSSKIYYITGIIDEPFIMLRKRNTSYGKTNQLDLKDIQSRVFDLYELEGFCVDLAAKVCSLLKIRCKFRIKEDGGFGSKNESTGIWNGKNNYNLIYIILKPILGMVADIVSRKADMAIAPLTISQKRMEVVDFSKPFMNLGELIRKEILFFLLSVCF